MLCATSVPTADACCRTLEKVLRSLYVGGHLSASVVNPCEFWLTKSMQKEEKDWNILKYR